MTIGLDVWRGTISNRVDPVGGLFVRQCQRQAPGGVSGSFLALGSDGEQWWVKAPHDPSLGKAVVTEYIVGRAGALIGAATCKTAIIEVTEDVVGWEYRPGQFLQVGIAHGTANVEAAVEERPALGHRSEDDNRRRHVGLYALFDWCFGSDQQWLFATTDAHTIYSHDHGWYLPPSGPSWDVASLAAQVDQACQLPDDPSGLLPAAVDQTVEALRSVTMSDLESILQGVPASWPVTDDELDAAGWFLQRRAPQVADRLEALVGGTTTGGTP